MASEAIIKNRRLKEINTLRNDHIETLIFELNENIIPTLSHRKGVDFFIINEDGTVEKWDQKVSKSPTDQFKNDHKDDWKEVAIKNPAEVAVYLYKHQDEGRFGADNRIFIVSLEEDVDHKSIKSTIEKIDLKKPYEIEFEYKHKDGKIIRYKTKCFVILLY